MGCTQSAAGSPSVEAAQKEAKAQKSFYQEYYLGKKLGAGAFGQVRVACPANQAQADDSPLAVKIVDLRRQKDDSQSPLDQKVTMETKCECTIWRRASDHHISGCVCLLEVFWECSCCFMVMERCDMNLLKALESAPKLDEQFLGNLYQQMLASVRALHDVGIVHRDIKPDNFLVNRPSIVKLADFGLSTVYRGGEQLTDVFGTAPFMSPEMLVKASYGSLTDVWSVGILMYVLTYGQFPYFSQEKSSKAMKMAIRDGRPPSYKPYKPGLSKPTHALEDVIRLLLARDPTKRPAAQEALLLPFFKNLGSDPSAPELPSMRPFIQGAIRAGAFTVPRRSKEEEKKNDTDAFLSEIAQKQKSFRSRGSLGSSGGMMSGMSSMSSYPAFAAQRVGSMASTGSSAPSSIQKRVGDTGAEASTSGASTAVSNGGVSTKTSSHSCQK